MAHKKYYVNCKGVFQGGGCKAISFIGAYQQALESGISFSGFAGTSAGAIMASLVAAGATPQDLKSFILKTDFSEFETKTAKQKRNCLYKIVLWFCKIFCKHLPLNYIEKLPIIFEELGFNDSRLIRKIIGDELKELLDLQDDVKFKDLKYPLMIVASDIKRNEIKIWSNEKTPNEKVAFAVESSCAVPFVYKPVNGCYVDGGLLCNLPTIVFPDKETCFDKVLAFTFKKSEERNSNKNKLEAYIENLASTIVEGSTSIQQNFRKGIDFISIEPYFELLDFKRINPKTVDIAINKGKNAFRKYLTEKTNHFNDLHKGDPLSRKEHIRAHVAYNTFQKNDHVVISLPDLSWTWDMFLSILKWKQDRSKIDVYVEHPLGEQKNEIEAARTRMLLHMGIGIYYVKGLPLYGYFFKRDNRWSGVSLIYRDVDNKKEIIGRSYNSNVDERLLNFIVYSLPTVSSTYLEPLPISEIKFYSIDENIIINKLKNVKQYIHSDIVFEDVEVNSVQFITKYVLGYKYRPMEELIKSYGSYPIYGAAAFEFADSKLSLIGPPVVEVWDGDYIVVNGNTRFLYACKNNITHLRCVVVRNVSTKLITDERYFPCEVIISDKTLKGASRYGSSWTQENYRKSFRPIEYCIRNPKTYLL